jgi:hypothetical protein
MFVTLWKFLDDVEHLSLKVEAVHFLVGRIDPFLFADRVCDALNVLHALRNYCAVYQSLNLVDVGHDCAPSNMLQTPTMTSKIKLVVVGRVLVLHFSETVLVGERDYGSLVIPGLLLASALHFDFSARHKTRWAIPPISCTRLPLQS